MLILNWRRHYYVPNIFYTDTDFKSTRKGKFFFLSDFVFKLIHKFCFKHILYYYIEYLFDRRLIESCLNVTSVLQKPELYLKHSSFSSYLIPYFKQLSENLTKKVNTYKFRLKTKFLVHFTYFNSLVFILKKNILSLSIKKIFLLNFFMKRNIFIKKFKRNIITYFYNYFLFFHRMNSVRFINNNIFFLLYQIKYLKCILSKKLFFFNEKHRLVTFFVKYVNFVGVLKSKKKYSIKTITLKKKKQYFFLKCKFKNINLNQIDSFYVNSNTFLKTFHQTLYYYFFLNKIIHFKYDNVLNLFNFNNLKLKKDLIYIFKKKFILFKKKINYIRFKHRKKFYFFLSTILSKRQWLIGPVHKIKMFKFMTYISNRINSSFINLKLQNKPFRDNKLSFFYNAVKIRERFFYFLGKKRYREEFLLLKNKKWYLKYYINQFYNISFKFFSSFYIGLRKKFKVKKVKDLFLFLEYNISIFIKKYLFDCFTDVYLNMNKINNNFKNLFFIGDVIDIKTTSYYYYEKFIIFFNFIYFIDPIQYKNKYNILYFLYKKIHNYFSNTSITSITSNIKVTSSKPSINSFFLLKKYKYFIFFQKKVINLLQNYKLYIKTLYFFIFKLRLLNLQKTLTLTLGLGLNIVNILNKKYNNFKNFLYVYSFNKSLCKFNLIDFKRALIMKKNKKIKYLNRKKSIGINLYNWFFYKKKRSFIYKGKIDSSFSRKIYKIFNFKKKFFINKKKILNLTYISNF